MRRIYEATGVGLIFGTAGATLAFIVRGTSDAHSASVAFLSAMFIAGVVWQFFVAGRHPPWWAICLVGGGIGLLSFPLFFYLMFESFWLMQLLGWSRIGPAGPAPGPLLAIEGALLYSLIAWILFGIPTVVLGAAAGMLASLLGRCLSPSRSSVTA